MNRKDTILFLFLLMLFTFFVQWSGSEQRSSFSLILALNNDHTLRIDRYADLTPDKAEFDGHYYSDKAPGLALLGLPAYAVLNAMQNLNRPGLLLPYSIYMVNSFVVALPSALLAILILHFLRRLGIPEGYAVAATLAMALGTLAFPFSTLFFSHQTAAFLGFAAFYLLYLARANAISQPVALAGAGFVIGLGVLVEYPMAVLALLLMLYALFIVRKKPVLLVYYVLGGIPAALVLMGYNYAAFGHPLHFSYFYETNTWAQVHRQGFLGLGRPELSTFTSVVAGPRGLFILSPVLLLALHGFIAMLREKEHRAEAALFASAFAVYLLMVSGYMVPPTDIWTPGPRFLVPVLPFLAAPLAFSLRRLLWLFLPLAAISMATMFIVTAANPQVPPEVSNPLLSYWLPGFFDRSQLVNTITELRFGISRGLSLAILAGAVAAIALAVGCALLLQRRPGTHSLAWNAVLALVLVLYLIVACPIDLRAPFDVPGSLRGAGSTTMGDQRSGQVRSAIVRYETLGHAIF